MSADKLDLIPADMHTHILPRFDDGSRSSAESVEMLKTLKSQSVSRVVITPHFYARRDEPAEFVSHRNAAAAHLVKRIEELPREEREALPELYLGAEVAFFNGMSICPELDEMCIKGTKYLLCEMPFDIWTSAMISELISIQGKRGITPIIAHIERYFSLFKSSLLDEMISEGMLVQSNAEAFLNVWTRGRALKLLEVGKIHLLGSDCHNTKKRAPNIAAALEMIEKKLGKDAVRRLCENSEKVLESAEVMWSPALTEGEND